MVRKSNIITPFLAEQVIFSKETHSNYYEDLKEEVALSKRVKRSVLAAIGITSQCEPGWTGQYCEHREFSSWSRSCHLQQSVVPHHRLN